ncbi:hypothetical protein D9M68_723140 [compost metagenome]
MLMASITGPHNSTTLKRHEAGPITRTMWWNTSRAITPGCSVPVSSTFTVAGTVIVSVSVTKDSSTPLRAPKAKVPKAPSWLTWPSKCTAKAPGVA